MKKRFWVFFLVLIYLFNNIFVSTTFGKFVQESTSEKFNVSATAQSQPKSLSESSWQEIYDVTVSGKAQNYWNIGDKTTVKVDGEDKEVVIIGINHDGDNTVTFAFNEYVGANSMNLIQGKPGTAGAATNAGGWESSYMRTTVMPDILSKMENKDYIATVEKKTLKENSNTEIVVTRDQLFLLSFDETSSPPTYKPEGYGEGEWYEYYKEQSNKIYEEGGSVAGEYQNWWLRTPSGTENFYFIGAEGMPREGKAYNSYDIVPAFVIGETVEEPSTLDLLPPFEMPEEFVAGESFIISEMPDFQVITENAMKVIPEDTEFYGWLIENELAQEIFEPEDAKYILEDTYSYGEEVELRITPVYKKVAGIRTISVNTEDLVNITIENLTEDTVSFEQDLILRFVIDKGYELPETIEVLIEDTSYIVNTNGEENPKGFAFNGKTFELTIISNVLLDKETLIIKATAVEIVKEVVEMLDGDGSEYDINSPEALVFKSEAPLADLELVQVNGKDLNPETDYTATEGSTIITLSEEYLSTLEIGEYTISIISTRMIANATFTVEKIVEEKESNIEEDTGEETQEDILEDVKKKEEVGEPEEIFEKTIEFSTEHLYNIEITEFADFEEDDEKELVIEENLELEFVLEEDYVLYKNIEILIDNISYVLDLTDEEQELEGVIFDIKDSILTIDFELFDENSSLVIKAVALEDIPLDELVEGEEFSITELLDVEELLKDIETPENTEFVGWLINDKKLEINNIVIQEILNDILAKIYPEIEQEKVQDENVETVLEDLENEESTEEIEEIETLLIPIFRLIKEEINLDGYVLGDENSITEIPSETVLEELIASNLTEELEFYGWLVDTKLKSQIVSQEDILVILSEMFESEEEIILTALYTVVETTEEQPEEKVEEESKETEEETTEPEENTESVEKEEVVTEETEIDSDKSVLEDEIIGQEPDESIPTEQTININTNLINISIPELSNGTITIANNENLIFSLETEKDYKLPDTVQVVIDKTYTVNTNEKGSPEDGVTFNVATSEITILNSLLLEVETITVEGTAVKIEKEDTETTQKETSTENVESSDNQSSNEKETVNEQIPEEEIETDNIPENTENTVTEPTDTNSEENNTETDIEASLEEQEQSNETDTDNTEQEATDIEDPAKNEDTDNIPSEEQKEDTNSVENESSSEDNSIEPGNNVVEKVETDKTDTEAGVAKESNSVSKDEQSSSSSNIPETSPPSTEPAVQSPTTTNTSTQNSSTSTGSSSGSSPDPGTSNSSNSSNTGNQSSSSSSGASSSVTTTTKKSDTSNEISGSETSSSDE